MKSIIGIISLLLISHSIFAEEIETKPIESNQSETKLLESDPAAIEATDRKSVV